MTARIAALLLLLAAASCAVPPQATSLLEGGLDRWRALGDANWRVEGGALVADRGSGFLLSREVHGDFELRVEFQAAPSTNSGVFVRCVDPGEVSPFKCYEVNIWDETPRRGYGTGSIVALAPVEPPRHAAGRWSTLEITARGDRVTVRLDGEVTADLRDGRHARGHVGLQFDPGTAQDGRGVVRFRRLELRPD